MTVYDRIDSILKERGLSRRKLAEKAGIPYSTMSSMFVRRSKDLSIDLLQKIANVLGVSIERFFDDQTVQQANEIVATGDKDENEVKRIRNVFFEDTIGFELYNVEWEAIEASDQLFLEKTKHISEAELKRDLLDSFKHLNRLGKFEALKRLMEISEFPRYRDDR